LEKSQLFSGAAFLDYVVATIKWKCARKTTRTLDSTNDICGPLLPAVVFAILESRRGPRSARDIYNFQHGLILPGHVTAMPIGWRSRLNLGAARRNVA